MKEFLTQYKTEVLILIGIIVVMFLPYIILSSGMISSETTSQNVEAITKDFTPVIIGILVGWIVFRAIKKNREDR